MKVKRFQLLVIVIILVGVAGCENEQEQAALSVVEDGITLLEDRSVTKAMRLTTRDFLVQPERLNQHATSKRLIGFFRDNGKVTVLHPTPEIEVREAGDSALVTMPFVVARKGVAVEALDDLSDNPEAWVERASRYTEVQHVEISVVRKDDRWLIRTVRFME